MPVDKNNETLLADGCWIWRNGTTWHPTKWYGDRVDPHPIQECFEMSWDADGKGTRTGRTAMMNDQECLKSQRTHEQVAYAESEQAQGPVEVTVL